MSNIWESLQKGSESIKNWIIAHQSNPLLWVGLFLLGLVVFFVTYNALQREK